MKSKTDKPVVVDTFYILDFDRCLGDTEKLQIELEASMERVAGISPAQLSVARREVEQSGGSFDAANYVKTFLLNDESISWDAICQDMIAHARQKDMLEPGAHELIKLLKEKGRSFAILTYGGADWQQTKLTASKLESVPVLITNDSNKGRIIASWRRVDGLFLIPPEMTDGMSVMARSIILLDDKALSFNDIPAGVSGYHIVRSDRKIMPSQEGELPEAIVRANGIPEAIKLLFSK